MGAVSTPGAAAKPALDENSVRRILTAAVKNRASDVHVRAGQPPMLRIDGQLVPLNMGALTHQDAEVFVAYLANAGRVPEAIRLKQADFAILAPGLCRFRCHLYRQLGSAAAVIRVVPLEIPGFAELNLPDMLAGIVAAERGLILVTGATGNGKTTTIASMLAYAAKHARKHILTIEDPVEFIIPPGESTVSQREVGRDAESYTDALEAALREDPDIMFIGEMRDRRTVEVALQAAESGHLVMSTIHTSDSVRTVERIAAFFETQDEQMSARLRFAEHFHAVVSQRLLPRAGGQGRVLASEVMLASSTIREQVRDVQKSKTLWQTLERSNNEGMRTFDQHLKQMMQQGLITMETAQAHATRVSDFIRDVGLDMDYAAPQLPRR